MISIYQSQQVMFTADKNQTAQLPHFDISTPLGNNKIESNCLAEANFMRKDMNLTNSCKNNKKSLRSVKSIIKQRRSDLKTIEYEIQTNLDLAKDRITLSDSSSSYKANRIVAILAMRRIKRLEKSLNSIKKSIRELKELKKLIENDISQQDEVSERIHQIISRDKQSNLEVDRCQAHSDDDLIHELNARLINRLLAGVSL